MRPVRPLGTCLHATVRYLVQTKMVLTPETLECIGEVENAGRDAFGDSIGLYRFNLSASSGEGSDRREAN